MHFYHILQRLLIEMNALKTSRTSFLWLTRLLIKQIRLYPIYFLTDLFLKTHHPFLMNIFQSSDHCIHSYFNIPSCSFFWSRGWLTFATFFEDHIKRSEKQKMQNCHFDLLESFFHRTTGFFILFVNICHMVFRISTPFVWCSQKWMP